jgi:hypothetical protein
LATKDIRDKEIVREVTIMSSGTISPLSLGATVKNFEKRLQWQREHGRSLSKQLYTKVMMEYFDRADHAHDLGKPLAFTSVLFFPEILNSMGVINFAPGQYAIQLMVQGYSSEYLDKGLARGLSSELCSCNIAAVGMAAEGVFPIPDLMFSTGQQPCDSAAIESELLNNIYKVPMYWFNYPYRVDPDTISYIEREFRDLVAFVEQHSSARYNEDTLQERLATAKECHDLYLQVMELRSRVPCPLGLRDAYQASSVRTFLEGLPETVEVYKAQLAEVKERVNNGKGAIPNERFRIVVGGVFPFWNMRIFDWLEKEFGAIVVIDFRNRLHMEPVVLDASDPIASLARKIIYSYPLGRPQCLPNPEIAEEGARVALAAQCNASLYFTHFGCKITCGAHRITSDTLKDIAGIPTLVVDVDAYDPRVVPESHIKDKLSQYFEMLDKMKL